MAAWFIIFADRGGPDSKTGEQSNTKENGPAIQGEGNSEGKANITTNRGGKAGSHGGSGTSDALPEFQAKGSHQELRSVQIIHLHLPDDAGSRELSESLAAIRMSWPDHITISTIPVASKPQILTEWRVSKAPSVVFQTEGQRLYTLEEVWPKDRLAKKIEQLIHGLVGVDKNWRPEIKGMERR